MWGICLEMAPYLLLGFLFSGIISVFIDDSLKKDKKIVLEAVKQDGRALQYADDSLKNVL